MTATYTSFVFLLSFSTLPTTHILREEKKDFVAFFNRLELSQVIMLFAASDEGQLVLRSNRYIGQLNNPIFQPFYKLAFVIFTVCFRF